MPSGKTFCNVLFTVVAGFFSNCLVTEITQNQQIRWNLLLAAPSLYVLVVCSVILYFYHRAVFNRETDLLKYLDDSYCKAYLRRECLPELTRRYKDLCARGENSDMKAALKAVEDLLGR